MRVASRLLGGLVLLAATATAAGPAFQASQPSLVRYAVDATLDPGARAIAGTVAMQVENTTGTPAAALALILYPNRFAVDDPGINDLNRRFVYPGEELVPGGMSIERVVVRDAAGTAVTLAADALVRGAAGAWPDTLLRVVPPAPFAPDATLTLDVAFRTVLPERFGPFGAAEGAVTALAGWFPLLATRAPAPGGAPVPVPAEVSGVLRVPRTHTVVVGDRVAVAAGAAVTAEGADGVPANLREVRIQSGEPGGPLLLSDAAYRATTRLLGGSEVTLLARPPRWAYAIPPLPDRADVVLDVVARVLDAWPVDVVPLPARLIVAEAPLRFELTAPGGPGVAVVSDRILRVHRVLREFHERDLAAAVYAAALRAHVAAREDATDAGWVTEAVAAILADRFAAEAHPDHRSVYDWIGLFNLFAIVDRFESAPKIPFSRTFFPEARTEDALGDRLETFAAAHAPGRTIATKLRNVVGDAEIAAMARRYLAGDDSFRASASAVHGESLEWLFAQWVAAPYPELNYAVTAELAGGDAPSRVRVTRTASRPIREPVEIEVRGRRDERVRLTWDDEREEATFVVETPWRARRVVVDPERTLLEDTRVDNAAPRAWQVVLDSADVTVTSSEFGLSALFVARHRYDYTKDVGLVAFFNDRSVGAHVGPRLHFGPKVDATTYRHNLYGFYTLASLRGDFTSDHRPGFRTDGTLGGVGVRYDYTDVFAADNPTSSLKVRMFGDLYHEAFGSSFDYLDGGVRASVVHPLLSHRTLVAGQVLNAFSTPIGSDRVPNQGRYSLGGDLGVRGIPVDERLGENVMLLRAELRQRVYPDLDWNLFDVLVLRQHQLRLFVDAGRVEDRRSSLYRVADFAVGAGIGVAAVYDFLGFHPGVFYVAVARRLDHAAGETNEVQFLFGTRQAF